MDAELLITKVGGEDVVYKAIARFIDLCLADEVIAPFFAKADIPHVTAMMQAFIAKVLGGTNPYVGKELGAAHAALGVTGHAFDIAMKILATSFTEQGVSEHTTTEVIVLAETVRPVVVTV